MSDYEHSDGALLKFPEEERCNARSHASGKRCRNRQIAGGSVCKFHGGAIPVVKAKAEQRLAVESLRAMVEPIDGTDPEANPVHAFEMEFRRTVAAIRFLDKLVAELDPEGLGWGTASEKTITASEFPGVDSERRSQANIYYQIRLTERKHLVDLVKIWVGAKLDVRKLEVEEQKINALNNVIEVVLTRLGHDIKSPEVRNIVYESVMRLPTADTDYSNVTVAELANGTKQLVSGAERHARATQRGRVGAG